MIILEYVLWAALAVAVIGVGVTGWFFAYAHAKHMREDNIRIGKIMRIPLYVYLYAGVAFDVAFNFTVGSVVYRELPKEWLFTTRTQRHVESTDWRRAKAIKWAQRLNKVDPGHVTLPH